MSGLQLYRLLIHGKEIFFLLIINLVFTTIQGKENDTLRIVSHDRVLMVTDPGRGVNEDIRWVVFPSENVPYRKITAHLTMQCPDGMKCGAWDYLDYVIVRRQGGLDNPFRNAELIRNLTPYGSWFDKEWKFTWKQDITDWACLLRDSVEIEYQHTGYEDNKKMGWLVTLEFEVITGKPVAEPFGYDSLWTGSFAYGDTLRPFETQVKPRNPEIPENARWMNWRIMQTGHGMDQPGNCSEFCSKWRRLYLDNQMVNERQMTITCGTNPLYPQSGTWIYSRSNWCPGSLAVPDILTLPVTDARHELNLEMEPYISTSISGGWSIAAYAFYYKEPSSGNDVALDAIITPSESDEYNRMNPIGFSPQIVIRNHGRNHLESVEIEYGLQGRKKQLYKWKGNLSFQQTEEIVLPGLVEAKKDNEVFEVRLLKPNKKKDEYPYDNVGYSNARKLPVYNDTLIVSFRTNKKAQDSFWRVKDAAGNIVGERMLSDSSLPETLYNDTLILPDGYYELKMEDISNDGLYFWARSQDGYGYIRLLNAEGIIIRDFNADFGSFIHHAFAVEKGTSFSSDVVNSVSPTTHLTGDMLGLDIVLNKTQDILIRITDKNDQLLQEHRFPDFSPRILQLDVSSLEPAFYRIVMQTEDGNMIRKTIKKI